MELRTTAACTLPELVRSLGVAEGDAAQVAARVAADNRLDPAAALPSGTLLQLPDALFPDVFDTRPGVIRLAVPATSSSTSEPGARGPRPLGPLGLHGLQSTASARRTNDLGALSSLLGIGVPGLVDRGHLEVKVPLRAGPASLPLGDGRVVAVDVPPGTTLRLSVTAKAGPRGLEVEAADLAFSRSVKVLNGAQLAIGGAAGAVADLAGALAGAHVLVDGVHLENDGRVVPRGKIERPSLNPLKHVFSDGKSSLSLDAFASLAPSMKTRLADLLDAGAGPGSSGGAAQRFDVRGVLDALGAVGGAGSFTMKLEGRGGFLDVGDGSVAVRGRDQPLVATLDGNFSVAPDGALDVGYRGKLSSPRALQVHLRLDEAAAGAGVGPVSVTATGDGMELRLDDRLLGVVRGLGDRYGVALGQAVEAELNGALTFGGKTRLHVDASGVHFEHEGVKARVEMGGTRLKSDAFDLTLADTSAVSLEATGAHLEEGRLVLENAHAGFLVEVDAGGRATRGALSAALTEPSRLEGTFAIGGGPDGVDASAQARFSVRARPRLAGLPLPVTVGVEQSFRVRLTRDAVAFSSSNDSWRVGV